MSGTIHKELRGLIKEAVHQGFCMKQTSKNHILLTRGSSRITVAGTPRNAHQAAKNLRGELRRAGAEV